MPGEANDGHLSNSLASIVGNAGPPSYFAGMGVLLSKWVRADLGAELLRALRLPRADSSAVFRMDSAPHPQTCYQTTFILSTEISEDSRILFACVPALSIWLAGEVDESLVVVSAVMTQQQFAAGAGV